MKSSDAEPEPAGDSDARELQGRPLWDPGRPGQVVTATANNEKFHY